MLGPVVGKDIVVIFDGVDELLGGDSSSLALEESIAKLFGYGFVRYDMVLIAPYLPN